MQWSLSQNTRDLQKTSNPVSNFQTDVPVCKSCTVCFLMMFLSKSLLVAATADTTEFAWLVKFRPGQPTFDGVAAVPHETYMCHGCMTSQDRATAM